MPLIDASFRPPREMPHHCGTTVLSFLKAILFAFVEKIRLGGTKIDNFRTTITILFLLHAFSTVICVRHPHPATDTTSSFKTSIIAFLTHMHQHGWIDKGIANDTLSVACEEKEQRAEDE